MALIDGKKLESARERLGKSQKEVGGVIGLTQGSYSVREKTGKFEDEELEKICGFLNIKMEQIQLDDQEVNIKRWDYLLAKSIQAESTLTILLESVAELLAKATNTPATRILADLKKAVNSLSEEALDELRLLK